LLSDRLALQTSYVEYVDLAWLLLIIIIVIQVDVTVFEKLMCSSYFAAFCLFRSIILIQFGFIDATTDVVLLPAAFLVEDLQERDRFHQAVGRGEVHVLQLVGLIVD